MKKPELLAPAGSMKKLKTAFYFGADAVYLGGKSFSLRTFADNFTDEELGEAVVYAHERGKKVYVCANIFGKNADFAALEKHFRYLETIGADAVLISDLGVFRLCRRVAPGLPVHISTQANTLNQEAAAMWKELGAERVVVARELSVKEIAEIHEANPDLQLEVFVHGAMCISYSGRCYLSDYLDGRESNRGACVQACRWNYRVQSKEGAKGEWYDLEADGRGTYVMNSKDLNMSAYLEELARAGVCSFKIEGRMKSEYYLATVVNAYRRIIDGGNAEGLSKELEASAHRAYTAAYAFGENHDTVSRENSQTRGTHEYIANVVAYENGRAKAEMRNRFFEGDTLEILSPSAQHGKAFKVENLRDSAGESCTDAKLVQSAYTFDCPYPLHEGDILRRKMK